MRRGVDTTGADFNSRNGDLFRREAVEFDLAAGPRAHRSEEGHGLCQLAFAPRLGHGPVPAQGQGLEKCRVRSDRAGQDVRKGGCRITRGSFHQLPNWQGC